MKKTIDKFLQKYNLYSQDKQMLVAFSGGHDSMCLLHALYGICAGKIIAIHLNHNWRGEESDNDEKKCKEFCENLNIKFYSEKLADDVKKTETEARNARYEFFNRSAKKFGTDIVFTAHTKSDNVETVLYRVVKGTGTRGLCGISEIRVEKNCNIYRPLLELARSDIETYIEENSLSPILDSSNEDIKYNRNYIRKKILPKLEKVNKNVIDAVDSLSQVAILDNAIIDEYLAKIKKEIFIDETKIDIVKYDNLSLALKSRIIYDFVVSYGLDYNRKKVNEILDFIAEAKKSPAGKTLSLTNNLWLFCSDNEIYTISKKNKSNNTEVNVDCFNTTYTFQDKLVSFSVLDKTVFSYPAENSLETYVDLSGYKNLTLRYRQQGDVIQPFGMKEVIKLKKYFINKKLPQHKKDEIMLLCNGKEVLWAIGVGISEKIRVKTNKVTHIKVEEAKKYDR